MFWRRSTPVLAAALAVPLLIFLIKIAEERQHLRGLYGGLVTDVLDGDTIAVGDIHFRIWGIQAPERSTEAGPAAKKKMERLVYGRSIFCKPFGNRMDHHRIVAKCTVAGVDVGTAMVKSGWAADWDLYSQDFYQKQEDSARHRHLGIWK